MMVSNSSAFDQGLAGDVTILNPFVATTWGTKDFYIEDPDGYIISFVWHPMNLETIVLWLFVINLGTVFGAGLYEARIVVPLWTSAPPVSLQSPDSGRQFWAFTSTIPLTLLTLASIAFAWQSPEQRDCWLLAAVLTLIERFATFGYFIPAMLRMQRAAGPTPELLTRLRVWQRVNYVRLLLTLVAWLIALKALVQGA